MKKIERKELELILEEHEKWLDGEEGVRADLRGVDLREANLYDVGLSNDDLIDVDLRDVDLRDADLEGADLRGANLSDANLEGACLRYADLRGADLRGAILNFADWNGCKIYNSVIAKYAGEYQRDVLYLYDLDVVYCGCFMGSLEKFKEAVEGKCGEDKMGYEIAIEEFER